MATTMATSRAALLVFNGSDLIDELADRRSSLLTQEPRRNPPLTVICRYAVIPSAFFLAPKGFKDLNLCTMKKLSGCFGIVRLQPKWRIPHVDGFDGVGLWMFEVPAVYIGNARAR